jgi:hypothetical protein
LQVLFPKKIFAQLVLGFFSCHSAKIWKKTKKNAINELHESRFSVTKTRA